MKVILQKNIPKVGQKGDVKEFKEGYVRNMLFPRGLAKIATKGELKNLANSILAEQEYHNAEVSKVADLFKKIDGKIVEISEKTNEKGHLFAKVGKDEVLKAMKEQLSSSFSSSWFEIDAIKEIGEYPIDLKFDKLQKQIILKISSQK